MFVTALLYQKIVNIYCSDDFILFDATHKICGLFDETGNHFAQTYQLALGDCPVDFELTDQAIKKSQEPFLSQHNFKYLCAK